MREDIWVEEEDDARRRPRSVVTILAVAAIPWAIVAGIVLLPDRDEPDAPGAEAVGQDEPAADVLDRAEPSDEEQAEDPRSKGQQEPPDDAVGSSSDPTPRVGEGFDPGGSVDLALAATATVVARAWATGIDPRLDVPGVDPDQRPRYAEHVAVESIDHAASGLAVVTLVAVVLEDFEDGLGADLRRIAVPLSLSDGSPRLAGMPWWLPPPEIHPAEVTVDEALDPALRASAADALQHAGYDDVEVSALYRTEKWPWIAGFTALAPGGEHVSGEAWLRHENDHFILAGYLPDDVRRDGGRP